MKKIILLLLILNMVSCRNAKQVEKLTAEQIQLELKVMKEKRAVDLISLSDFVAGECNYAFENPGKYLVQLNINSYGVFDFMGLRPSNSDENNELVFGNQEGKDCIREQLERWSGKFSPIILSNDSIMLEEKYPETIELVFK